MSSPVYNMYINHGKNETCLAMLLHLVLFHCYGYSKMYYFFINYSNVYFCNYNRELPDSDFRLNTDSVKSVKSCI